MDQNINEMSATNESVSPEEEDAIVTLVVIIVAIIIAIIFLFSLGLFLDCKHQTSEKDRKMIKLKISSRLKSRRTHKSEDIKSLANEMCPTGTSGFEYNTRDAVV